LGYFELNLVGEEVNQLLQKLMFFGRGFERDEYESS